MAIWSISVFDIPLLKDEVTQYLSKQDLAQCLLVSKEWHTWFTPILWRRLDFSRAITPEEYAGLLCNQSHVRSIHGLQLASEALSPSPQEEEEEAIEEAPSPLPMTNPYQFSFPILQSLHLVIGQEYNPIVDMTSLRLIESTPHLSSLFLDISIYQIHQELVQTLKSIPQLQKLDITGRYIPTIFIQDIVESCSNIDSVGLHFKCAYKTTIRHREENYLEAGIVAQFSHRLQDTRIRELSIHLSLALDESAVLVPLLKRCPLLEKLRLERVRLPNTIRDISVVFEEGKCPRLKRLEVDKVNDFHQTKMYTAMMLQAIGRGKPGYGVTFGRLGMDGSVINNNEDNSNSNDGDSNDPDDTSEDGTGSNSMGNISGSILETLILGSTVKFELAAAIAITQFHAETLTHLSLPRVHLSVLTDLMRDLNRIQSVTAVLWLENRMSFGVDLEPIFNKRWNCLAINRLDLDLDLLTCHIPSVLSQNWIGSLADRCMSFLMSQMARLEELQELRLKCDVNLLTSDKGPSYLTRLSTLKRLEVLKLDRKSTSWPSMGALLGAEEAEWMNESWPRLRKVVYKKIISSGTGNGIGGSIAAGGVAISGVSSGSSNRKGGDLFMDTFLEKRPWLQVDRQD
ncbi:hypothetical protein BGX26_009712 [Mortierella sp. AD094]|nr:hypothetical protein BGX26_009712 [Mortierella sp. AD094]